MQNPKNIKDILNLAIEEVQQAYQVEMNIENILYYAQDIINNLKQGQNIRNAFWNKLLKLQDII